MAQYQQRVSGWAIGGMTFAASVMVLIGVFQALAGLAALINDSYFVVGHNYAYHLDATSWGIIHLILGILVAFAGFSLFAGKQWAAVTALFLAMLSALANFFWIPYQPWWALIEIGLAVWVIWALTRPGVTET